MVLLIAGATHTGKTALAQKLLERYKISYLSADHLKMGLIRSENTSLTPTSDDKDLTDYLWPIIREIVKTVIENKQNIIIEGCYIPFDWVKSFDDEYLSDIKYVCLVMSESYIRAHYSEIKKYAGIIESRIDDSDCTVENLVYDNKKTLEMCKKYKVNYHLIDSDYSVDMLLDSLMADDE